MTTLHREEIRIRIPRQGGVHEAIIIVLGDGGLEGLGEAALVPGRDPALAMQAAEECARLDLEARGLGVPLVDLLGGPRRSEIPCNCLLMERAPAAIAAEVERLQEAGFQTFKLKAVDRGGDLDLARLGAARFAGGRSARLRIDFNGSLDIARAGAVLRSLEQFELELIEQPLAVDAPFAVWEKLLADSAVAADESLADPELAARLAAAGFGLAIKLATVGGSRAALRLAAAGRGRVLLASSHETSIGLAAAVHTACALEREPLACGLATAALLEADPGLGLEMRSGVVGLPPGPGLGVTLDRGLVQRYRGAQ